MNILGQNFGRLSLVQSNICQQSTSNSLKSQSSISSNMGLFLQNIKNHVWKVALLIRVIPLFFLLSLLSICNQLNHHVFLHFVCTQSMFIIHHSSLKKQSLSVNRHTQLLIYVLLKIQHGHAIGHKEQRLLLVHRFDPNRVRLIGLLFE